MTDTVSIADDFTAWCNANRTRVTSKIEGLKRALLPALNMRGIASVEVIFDGYGDSGAVEAIECRDATDAEVELADEAVVTIAIDCAEPKESTIGKALEDLTYAALELHHSGWENNDGAGGSLEIDVAAAKVMLDCKLRYTAYDEHNTEI